MNDNITVFGNGRCYIEQQAIDQLYATAKHESIVRVVGLPDLHPGNVPNGMAVLTREKVFPHLIGSDIGCGMTLFGLGAGKFKAEVAAAKFAKVKALADIKNGETGGLPYS